MKLKPDDFKDVEAQAKALAQPVAWSEMRTKLAGTIADALNVSVLDGWAAAWQKWKLVKEKVEESRKNPTAEVPCELFEHTIESTLHPYLEVLMGQTPVQRVDFDVTLSTEFDSVRLNLKNGNLVSLQPGACVWSGSVALHGAELLHQPLAQLDLPGSVVLKEARFHSTRRRRRLRVAWMLEMERSPHKAREHLQERGCGSYYLKNKHQ